MISELYLGTHKNLIHHLFKWSCGVYCHAAAGYVFFGFVQPQDECALALAFAPFIIGAAVEPGIECRLVNLYSGVPND